MKNMLKKIISKKNRRGSILLEALLSVVILSVSMTVIIQSMTSSLRAMEYSANYTMAIVLLENKIIDLILQNSVESA